VSRQRVQDGISTALIGILLVAVGALAWRLELRSALHADTSALSALPEQLGEWHGEDLPLEEGAESMLRADFNVLRAYTDPSGALLWAYVGYYGTTRGGRPEHTPAACYEAHGWSILERRVLGVPGAPGLQLTEYLVEQGQSRQLVQFWFRSYRSTGLIGGWDQTLDRLLGRLHGGRADGALVRVSTPVSGDDVDAARSRLLAFAPVLDSQLAVHWPTETPIADAR
jgi:EpsI family protein